MKENIEYLQNLGLTEYQSKAAVVLLAKREATAEEIGKYSGVPMSKIYSVLKSLDDKGITMVTAGKPRLYKCAEPAEVINLLIQKINKRVEWLKEEKREQLKKIRTIDWQIVVTQNNREKTHPMFAAEIPA